MNQLVLQNSKQKSVKDYFCEFFALKLMLLSYMNSDMVGLDAVETPICSFGNAK